MGEDFQENVTEIKPFADLITQAQRAFNRVADGLPPSEY